MMDGSEGRELVKDITQREARGIHRRFQLLAVAAIIVIAIGTVFMHMVEKLRWLDSLYFSVVSLTTAGYGDITPHTDAGKVFVIVYLLIGIGIIAALVNTLLHNAVAKRVIKKGK